MDADGQTINRILCEAKTRWLKTPEIVDIIRNYQRYHFRLSQTPPDRPASGSMYLFDRKVVRFFRKDNHNWRKKKDNKTVREAHEKLKDGSEDALHCYYAHSEDDDRFQRRCYWLLEKSMEHIVLVHYLEVEKGSGRVQPSPRNSVPTSPTQNVQGNLFGGHLNENWGVTSPSQESSGSGDVPQGGDEVESYVPPPGIIPSLSESLWEQSCQKLDSFPQLTPNVGVQGTQDFCVLPNWMSPQAENSSNAAAKVTTSEGYWEEGRTPYGFPPQTENDQSHRFGTSQTQNEAWPETHQEKDLRLSHPIWFKNSSLDIIPDITKDGEFIPINEIGNIDSDENWLNLNPQNDGGRSRRRELTSGDDAGASHAQPEVLFTINKFAADTGPTSGGTRVLIVGESQALPDHQWGCLFGEIEVSANVVAIGVLECLSPPNIAGPVKLVVTSNNRIPCSSSVVFHYFPEGDSSVRSVESRDKRAAASDEAKRLQIKLVHHLLEQKQSPGITNEDRELMAQLYCSPLEDSVHFENLFGFLLKHQMVEYADSIREDTRAEIGGMTVLQLVSALGYDWAIPWLTKFGVGIDQRDSNGCTALHWAAACGREKVVEALLQAGADPDAVAHIRKENGMTEAITPAQIADKGGYPKIASYLKTYVLQKGLKSMSIDK